MEHSAGLKLLALSALFLASCAGSGTSGSSSEASTPASSADSLSQNYGAFSLTATENGAEPVYDATTKTYTLAVSSKKAVYTLSGYFEGTIVIANPSALTSYKGVELILNNTYLKAADETLALIHYELKEKYLQLDAASGTTNILSSSATGVDSENNLRLGGAGELDILSSYSHGVKGDDIGLYGSGTIKVAAGADALHGKNLFSDNLESGTDLVAFTGTMALSAGASEQAIDCCDGSGTSEDPWTGSITIGAGAVVTIGGAANVARCNTLFEIDGSVTATGITSSPIITKAEGSLSLVVNGSFSVDGTAIPSQTL